MTTTEKLDHIYEILNGLSIAWNLANVRDNSERAKLQAPINAAMLSAYEMLAAYEAPGTVNLNWAREHYGKEDKLPFRLNPNLQYQP